MLVQVAPTMYWFGFGQELKIKLFKVKKVVMHFAVTPLSFQGGK